MICVDTSVWIAAFRHPSQPIRRHLWDLLDADEVLLPVAARIELLIGASTTDQIRLRADLSALPLAAPAIVTWRRIEAWLPRAAAAGERFGFADLLIAALAADHDAPLWSLDRDFARMARLGFLRLYECPS